MGNAMTIFNVEKDYGDYLKHSLKFLLRIVIRPAVDLFLRYPRELNRKQTINLYRMDVFLLEIFDYVNKKNLPASLLREIHTIAEKRHLVKYLTNDEMGSLVEPNLSKNRLDMLDQLKEDVTDFFEYLKESVYLSSNIEKFYQQEVDDIKNKFIGEEEDRRGWQYLAFEAIDQSNPNIPNLNKLQHVDYKLNFNLFIYGFVFFLFLFVVFRLNYKSYFSIQTN